MILRYAINFVRYRLIKEKESPSSYGQQLAYAFTFEGWFELDVYTACIAIV
jgi:hypothetical protein